MSDDSEKQNSTIRYKVEITQIIEWTENVKKNLVVEKIPQGNKDTGYGGRDTIYHEKYQVVEVSESRKQEREIFTQQVDKLDVPKVIAAVNNMPQG